MKNKKSIIRIGILVSMTSLLMYFIFFKEGKNEIFVTVDKKLSRDLVRIEHGSYSINNESDKKLVTLGLDEVVFSNNKPLILKTICGENDFLIIYDNQYYTIIRHFIPNDFYNGMPGVNIYNFDLEEREGKLFLNLSIKGVDSESFSNIELAKISDASENIWGSKIIKTDAINR